MKKYLYLISVTFIVAIIACQSNNSQMTTEKTLAFIGTYTQKEGHVDGKGAGVLIYETGAKAEDWKHLGSFGDIINPSYICLSKKLPIIYAVSEQGPNVPEPKSVVKVIEYNPETFEMKELQTVSALGDAPCYISTDNKGEFLYVANYVTGNVIQYIIEDDGKLQEGISTPHFGKGPDARQEGPHAHYVKQHPTSEYIYSVDLGLDKVFRYEKGSNGLEEIDSISIVSGSGPRHIIWHPNGKSVYVITEMAGTIEHWSWSGSKSEREQIVSLLPDSSTAGAGSADIHIDKKGQYIYASIRGDFNEIVVFKIDSKSQDLSFIQRVSVGGEAPRNFAISPAEDYLAVALQNSDKITLFARNPENGLLTEQPQVVEVKTPVCVVYQE
jgi:6-phosphogluconolactonase